MFILIKREPFLNYLLFSVILFHRTLASYKLENTLCVFECQKRICFFYRRMENCNRRFSLSDYPALQNCWLDISF